MLTKHQSEKKEEALRLLENNIAILIEGSAGVGKTFMLKSLIENLGGKKVLCSAPTHKALEILREKVGSIPGVHYMTAHSALKMKRVIKKDGSVTFKPSYKEKYPPLKDFKYFVIDESSMLNKDLLEIAEHSAKNQNCKIIFVGDIKQINPIGEEISPVFTRGLPTITLTEIIRQDFDSPIIPLSLIASELGSISGYDNDFADTDGSLEGYITSSNRDKIISELAKANGSDSLKYIAYTNSEVDAINRDVRNVIYGKPNKIEVGETIVLSAPHKDTYFNNEEIEVESVEIREISIRHKIHKFKDRFDVLKVKFYSIKPKKSRDGIPVDILHEDSDKEFSTTLNKIKTECIAGRLPWPRYYELLERFAEFKYNHALTVHKSQGSSYDTLIINVGNINIIQDLEEKKKLLYTAITRTKKLLILYNTI